MTHMQRKKAARITAILLILLFTAGCGKKQETIADPGSKPETPGQGTETVLEEKQAEPEKQPEEAPAEAPEEEEEVVVDEEWQKILAENGTLYDAFYALPGIMERESPNHPVDVKLPAGLETYNPDYYDRDTDHHTEPADMNAVAGQWLVQRAKFFDIDSDYTEMTRDGDVRFYLTLEPDGTGMFDLYGGGPVTWDEMHINLSSPMAMECTYQMEENILRMWFVYEDGKDFEWQMIREGTEEEPEEPEGDLGKELPDGRLYRMVRTHNASVESEEKIEQEADPSDPALDPADHFVVLVETNDKEHSGYGYMRDGEKDTAIYYQTDRGLIKWINEDPGARNYGMGRRRLEVSDDGKRVKIWQSPLDAPDIWTEYELTEGEEIPVSHLAVGPAENRDFEIPDGTHEGAGLWRLDYSMLYFYWYRDPFYEYADPNKIYTAGSKEMKGMEDYAWGRETRKYGADIWYVLEEDGTGYMCIWGKYFELVWDDESVYCYDASGRHLIAKVIGELDYDACFTRLYKDEINPVPERPEELGGPREKETETKKRRNES
ncbi:MAG: hypothetical protein IK096_00160 [Lachnospiraceae bacterium]|nr:hypothetical protein [Lachnospiraceae bacterium]